VIIPIGNTLTIGPGVSICSQGYYKINVEGSLRALGTASDTIRFYSSNPDIGWDGIHFLPGSSNSAIEFCIFADGKTSPLAQYPWDCGGAIDIYETNFVIRHCMFSHNVSAHHGGAVSFDGDSLTISNCSFVDNHSEYSGGAVWSNADYLYNSDNIFKRNTGQGGGLFTGPKRVGKAIITIQDCFYEGNFACALATNAVGGIVDRCIFTDNGSLYGGAAVNVNSTINEPLKFKKCLFYNNSVSMGRGGAIYINAAACALENCTIINNTSYNEGGGIVADQIMDDHMYKKEVTISNSIVWNNSSNDGSQIHIRNPISSCTTSVKILYSDIEGGFEKITNNGMGTFRVSYRNNLDTNPFLVNPYVSDFHLASGSPCIDAGDPDFQDNDPEDPSNPGFALWPAMGTIRNDMGAYGGGGQSSVDFKFTEPGWYMVSLPVISSDSSVTALFPKALGGIGFTWNSSDGSYETSTKLEPKKGYWIAVSETFTSFIVGTPLDSYTIHFPSQGWYMIGSPNGGCDFTNPNDNPDGSVLSPAFGWDPVSESYVPTTTLNEKQGYWVAVFGECDLTLGAGGGMARTLAVTDWESFYTLCGKTPPKPPEVDWKTGKVAGLPKEYGLSQNYPNPFSAGGGSAFGGNPMTTIEYQIPNAGDVKLIIYNTMGQKVRILVDGPKNAGHHKAAWDGRNDAGETAVSGVYLFRIQAGDFACIRKLLFMR
jgi:hypothetical protein